MKKVFLGALLTVFALSAHFAGINFSVAEAADHGSSGIRVGGIIWENTTWTLENSPYIITDTVQIPENVTLTIEAGVSVTWSKSTWGQMFLVHGTIYAHGTTANEIIFDGGGYADFFAHDGSKVDAFLDLEYCVIKNGCRFWPQSSYVQYGHFILRYSELINLSSISYVWYPPSDVYIEYNMFINTAGFSIGHRGANVYLRYNLFKGKIPAHYADFLIENWAAYDESQTIVKHNSFIDMDGIVLRLPPGYSSAAMTATENYWETNDTDIIDLMIYDKNDDIRCAGFINYLPILTKPHPDTPSLPLIVNFTYSPSPLYANVTATFDASASFGLYSSIANYTWNFGDGNTVTTQAPIVKHAYTTPNSYIVNLMVIDKFGFQNSTVGSVTVLEDDTPPLTVEDHDRDWHNTDFTITLTAVDRESGVAETYYRICDGPAKNISVDGQPRITIEGANNTLEYWSMDKAGNKELPHKILTGIKLDKTAPAGSIIINDDATYTTSTSVTLTLIATDDASGVYQVRFRNDGVWDTEPWEAITTTKAWILPSGDGTKIVTYQIRDNAGLVSSTYSDTIVLDTTPPIGSITIDGGATYTNSSSVTLTVSAQDITSGVAQMRFSNDNATWEPWETYATFKTWALTTGDETKTVYVQFKDNAGLSSQSYFDTIVLDKTTPNILITSPSLGYEIRSSTVTVMWTGSDATSGIGHYEVRLEEGSWINIGINTTYTFTGLVDGSHTIVIKAIDKAGNTKQDTVTFTINTGLIGGPGWTEEIIILSAIIIAIMGTVLCALKIRRH